MATAGDFIGMAFMPYYTQLMRILDTDEDLKKSAKGIFHQMAYAAGGAAIGGVCLGPVGALAGTMIGGVIGYMTVSDYDAMVNVLRNMNDERKKELVRRVTELVGSSSIEALITFIGQQARREMFVNFLRSFASEASKGG